MADYRSSSAPTTGTPAADRSAGIAVPEAYALLLERFTRLLETLLAERKALTGTSPDRLSEVVARKEALCAEIAGPQRTLLDALQPATTLPESMADLRRLADRCRVENALNGRIASRARRTTRNLLNLLTGEDAGEAYGRRGREAFPAPGTGHRLGSA